LVKSFVGQEPERAFAKTVGQVVNHYKVAKHFALTITDDDFHLRATTSG
jgi:hypothetical protein